MNPEPLTSAQQAAITRLVGEGRLRTSQPTRATPDLSKFIDQATDSLIEIGKLDNTKVIYDVAYNIAHDVGEAVLAAYGYRTTSGSGQHQAVGEALAAIFDTPPGSLAVQGYDNFRLTRNAIRYRASVVSPRDSRDGVSTATALLEAAKERLGCA